MKQNLFPAYLILSYGGLKDTTIILSNYKQYELGIITLSAIKMEEYIVESIAPILIKKDTIEFNSKYFKTKENAVIEDLLKKLPGIEVDIQGNIFVNGRKVNKIMIDGKDFFGNDPLVASRNLPAIIVDKVQVVNNNDNNSDGLSASGQIGKTINIKLKKNFKSGVFGKAYAGYGSKQRFEAGLLANSFRDTTQYTLIGFA